MCENGGETVNPYQWARDWQPAHKGCSVSLRYRAGIALDVVVRWVRPPIKGLDRIKYLRVFGLSAAEVKRGSESEISRITDEDSLNLLARGPRSQRADTDRFEAEKLQGELCPI